MTDIHTHILFGTDDGAKDIETSIKMLETEISDGVDTVVLTPHFDYSKQSVEKFVLNRDKRVAELKKEMDGRINILAAAEVVASPFLARQKRLESLCIEGTKTVLVELPENNFSIWLEDMIYELQLGGYTPVLAHIERYKPLRDIKTLKKLTELGAVMQVNCSLFSSASLFDRIFVKKAVKNGVIQVMGSDCHSMNWRPPCYANGVSDIKRICSSETARKIVKQTDEVAKKGYISHSSSILI